MTQDLREALEQHVEEWDAQIKHLRKGKDKQQFAAGLLAYKVKQLEQLLQESENE